MRFEFSIKKYALHFETEGGTTVANTHMEDLCVRGVAVLLNDVAKLILAYADLTVLTAFVRERLLANVCQI